jgi:hypothetical protein
MKILLKSLNADGEKALNKMLESFKGREKFRFMRAGIRLFLVVVSQNPLVVHYHQVMLDSIPISSLEQEDTFKFKQAKNIYDNLKKYGVNVQNVEVIIK